MQTPLTIASVSLHPAVYCASLLLMLMLSTKTFQIHIEIWVPYRRPIHQRRLRLVSSTALDRSGRRQEPRRIGRRRRPTSTDTAGCFTLRRALLLGRLAAFVTPADREWLMATGRGTPRSSISAPRTPHDGHHLGHSSTDHPVNIAGHSVSTPWRLNQQVSSITMEDGNGKERSSRRADVHDGPELSHRWITRYRRHPRRPRINYVSRDREKNGSGLDRHVTEILCEDEFVSGPPAKNSIAAVPLVRRR